VLLVFHEQDGDWQFLSSLEANASEVLHIHLSHLLDADATLGEVADLPLGWKAWRLSVGEEWIREPTPTTRNRSKVGDSSRDARADQRTIAGAWRPAGLVVAVGASPSEELLAL
jgi:hypothetical protein